MKKVQSLLLDTNCWFKACERPEGGSALLLRRALEGEFLLILSDPLEKECREHIPMRKSGQNKEEKARSRWLHYIQWMASLEYTGQIKRVSLTLEDLSSWNGVTPDPDDRHILAAAFKADVDHITSTDVKHLLNGSVQKNIHHRWFELKMEKPNNESTPLVLSPKHFFEQYPKYRS